MKKTIFYSVLFLWTYLIGPFCSAEGAVLKVGTNWSGTQYTTIQAAVDAAAPSGDEIWVEQGTYMLTLTITVSKSVALYGGFTGSETAREQRNWVSNVTTVDGNNSFRCFQLQITSTGTAVIDGFTITKGDTNSDSTNGAGIANGIEGGVADGGNLTVANCIFTLNSSGKHGAISNEQKGNLTVINCTFSKNTAGNRAGAINHNEGAEKMTVTGCTFSENSAGNGGVIYVKSTTTDESIITDCVFSKNQAATDGGAIMDDQTVTITRCTFDQNSSTRYGTFVGRGDKSAVFTNCVFSKNSTKFGGGIAINGSGTNSNLNITNCTFSGNTLVGTGASGGAIYTQKTGGIFTVKNCILLGDATNNEIAGGTPTVTYTDIDQDGYAGSNGNIRQDPLFAGSGNYHLQTSSPCIDTGTSLGAPSDDLEGTARPQGSGYDMGAYETPLYLISGSVTGAVQEGVTITISGSGAGSTTTDYSGNYLFSVFNNGTYTVTPSKNGYTFMPVSREVTVSGADVSGVNFTATAVTYSISGTVTGAVQAGVTMMLSGTGSATTTTDASGSYSFTGLSNGTYTVTPSKSGYTFMPVSREVTVSGADVSGVNFTATEVTYSISGTVTGAVQAGVTMMLSGTGSATTTTDASGSYSFTGLSNGTYTVTPSKSGYTFMPVSREVTVSGADVSGVNITATAVTYSISGTVTGAVQAGVTMMLSGAGSATTTTDSLGNYTFTGLSNGTYTVTPGKSGYSFSPSSILVKIVSADQRDINFTANVVTYSISGAVVHKGSGLSGVTVTLSGNTSGSLTTDVSGNYTFTGLSNGTYTVTPSKSGYIFTPSSREITISSTDVSNMNFVAVVATYSISGTVIGAVQSDANMTLSGAGSGTTTTDASGNYAFNGLENGTYVVTPGKSEYTFTPGSREVTVAGVDISGVDFVSSVSSCTIWSDVITTYNAYVIGEAIWSDVIECYNEYASP